MILHADHSVGHKCIEVLKDKLLNAKTAEVEIETPTESQPATGSSGSENDASKSEDSRKGFRKRNITAYENKLRYNYVSTFVHDFPYSGVHRS